ncbi:MAG: conjugal transfer protein TraF [Cyclobacteriaceae bacterium]
MKKLLYISLLAIANLSFGQFNLSFYQMGGATPQHNNYNAAAFPKSRSFVSFPVISGIDMSVNNSFGMTDILTTTGDSTLIDVNRFLAEQKEGAYMNMLFTPTIFMAGFRTGQNGFVTLFVNERLDATLFYPIKLVNFLWEGNKNFIGEEYEINDLSYDMTYYREVGLGYGRDFEILGKKTSIGVRAKYLIGVFHASIEDELNMSVYTSEDDYSIEVALKSGTARSAGYNALVDESDFGYAAYNGNTGFGFDLGVQMELTDRLSVGLAANDMGFINWSDDSETASFTGTSFTIEGASFDEIDALADAVMDSIDALEIDTVANSFRTSLNTRLFLSGSYRVTEQGYAQATISNYFTQGKMRSAFGVGYMQNLGNWLTASVTGSIAPQSGADMGVGLMLRGGFFQLYTNVDNLFGTLNIPQASGLNFKFGINFLFGKAEKKEKKSKA